jgi:hypothetical protein
MRWTGCATWAGRAGHEHGTVGAAASRCRPPASACPLGVLERVRRSIDVKLAGMLLAPRLRVVSAPSPETRAQASARFCLASAASAEARSA